jgi:hypothetical protein
MAGVGRTVLKTDRGQCASSGATFAESQPGRAPPLLPAKTAIMALSSQAGTYIAARDTSFCTNRSARYLDGDCSGPFASRFGIRTQSAVGGSHLAAPTRIRDMKPFAVQPWPTARTRATHRRCRPAHRRKTELFCFGSEDACRSDRICPRTNQVPGGKMIDGSQRHHGHHESGMALKSDRPDEYGTHKTVYDWSDKGFSEEENPPRQGII